MKVSGRFTGVSLADRRVAHVGDTLHKVGENVDPVEGFLLMKPMVTCLMLLLTIPVDDD